MGAAPRVCPGGTQGLPGFVRLPPSLHLLPWSPSRLVALSLHLCVSVSPSCALCALPTLKMGVRPPVLRKGLCPRLGLHRSGSFRMSGAAVGRKKPHPLPCFSPFCLSGSPPRCPVKGECLGGKTWVQVPLPPLLTVDPRSFLLSLSLFIWKMRLKSTPAPRVVGATGEEVRELGCEVWGSHPLSPHLW